MRNKIFLIVIILIGLGLNIFPQQKFRSVIFLNRSVGNQIWSHAGASTTVPNEITAYNTAQGYTGADAVSMVKHYPFPNISTDNEWYRWHTVWNGGAGADSDSLYNYLNGTTYDIIVIKTCYPASDIFEIRDPCPDTTARYAQRDIGVYKWHLRSIVKIMEAHPDKFFSIWTLIPQYAYSDANSAGYALWFSTWMKDTLATGLDATYGPFPDNVYIFDYFRKIADGTGHAPLQYVDGPGDDHPSALAAELIDPLFVEEIFDAAIFYEINYPLPVELSAFSATIIGSSIQLNWRTETEVNNYGFEVERKINNWEKIGFVQGNGNSNSPKNYSFIDKNMANEKYFYRLKQIDNDGQFEYSKVIEVNFNLITTYTLKQNYPNPFNPSTIIKYSLPNSSFVQLIVYNSIGQEIANLVNEITEAGDHTVDFYASNLPSGIYLYKLQAGSFIETKKMILMK